MPKFIIERETSNAENLIEQELKVILQKSCSVLKELGTQVHWLESFVTDN